MKSEDTIAALSTPPLISAIGVIRISGSKSVEITEKMFSAELSGVAGNRAIHGFIMDGEKSVDEVIVTVFRAPSSYTGEDTVEISCHGSLYIINRILSLAFKNGARQADRGEFTRRAVVNGKMDLVKAEAVIDLIESESEAEAQTALSAVKGNLSDAINNVRDALLQVSAQILAFIDYPDDEIEDVSPERLGAEIQSAYEKVICLAESYGKGKIIKGGVRTVICGRPNAGKSMLMNRLVGYDRSIVTSSAGTTRDVVEDTAVIRGIKLVVSDTAGIRESDNEAEQIGIKKAEDALLSADLILYVCDLTETYNDIPEMIKSASAKKIAVFNKIDASSVDNPSGLEIFDGVCRISAKTGEGIENLKACIGDMFEKISVSDITVMNARQYGCLKNASDALRHALDNIKMTPDAILTDVEDAIQSLGETVGKTVNAEITDNIFSRFCVGK